MQTRELIALEVLKVLLANGRKSVHFDPQIIEAQARESVAFADALLRALKGAKK